MGVTENKGANYSQVTSPAVLSVQDCLSGVCFVRCTEYWHLQGSLWSRRLQKASICLYLGFSDLVLACSNTKNQGDLCFFVACWLFCCFSGVSFVPRKKKNVLFCKIDPELF